MANSSNSLRDWYSISTDSVRSWMSLGLVALLVAGGYLGYQDWSSGRLERGAFYWVARAETLLSQARAETDERVFREELDYASQQVAVANGSLEQSDFASAQRAARDAYQVLQGVLKAAESEGSIAWFRGVQGDVRYRRGDQGEFQRAFPRIELRDGDYVMAGPNASAEIHFRDEDTVFTLRPSSLLKLTRRLAGRERTLGEMEYGWVALETSEVSSGVRTRSAELFVGENSTASVVQSATSSATVRVESGVATAVARESGERRDLHDRQQLEATGQALSQPVDLPAPVTLVAPEDGFGINIDQTREVDIEWTSQAGAARYALQVARNRLFADTYVDVENRRQNRATLAFRAPGSFVWRVAAIDSRGVRGPWSTPRWLRVESYRDLALEVDREPPAIEVEVFMNGNLALVQGRTEPGSTLTLNGEPIQVAADGTFASTQWLFGVGRIPLTFRAVDAAGNDTVTRQWVYLDEA